MTNESSLQRHRNFGRLASASTSAGVAAFGVFAACAVPMKLSHMVGEFPTPQLWGIGIVLEIVLIGAIAAMVRDTYDTMRH